FKYPLGQLMGLAEPEVAQEKLQYVALPQQTTEHSGAGKSQAIPAKRAAPAPLQAPSIVPTAPPKIPALDTARAQAAGGTGNGWGVSGSGLATGLVPREPDPRIALSAGPITRAPRTTVQDVDSIVSLAIGIVRDSMAIAA